METDKSFVCNKFSGAVAPKLRPRAELGRSRTRAGASREDGAAPRGRREPNRRNRWTPLTRDPRPVKPVDMVVPDYAQFGGKHCETGSLKNVLAYLGVAAPHTGRPFSEEMLLGIGGGIGVSYWLFRFGEMAFFFIGTRYAEKGPGALFLQQVAKRLGIATKVYETSSAKRGAADLEAVLNAGRPAVVWVDMPMLPYLGIPETAHFGGHAIVVYGLDDGRALIADRAGRAVGVKDSELAAARASKFKPFPPKHKLMDVDRPANPISSQTLERAVVRGISDCCRQLLHGPIQNIGLQALPK